MSVASRWVAFGVLVFAAGAAEAASEKETPANRAERAYAVTCRVVGHLSAEDIKARHVQPLSFTVPRIVVSNGGTANIGDKSEKAFAFGDGLTVQGKRGAIERKATEGTTVEATVIAQDDTHVVLDLAVELTSTDSAENQGCPVRVDFFKARWIERVELDKTVKFTARDGHVEVTVKAIGETDRDSAPTADRNAADARPVDNTAKIAYVKYVGTRFNARHLRKQTGLQAGQPLDAARVEAGRDNLVAYYRDKGYRNAIIEIVEGTGRGDEGVVYKIDDGEQVTTVKQ